MRHNGQFQKIDKVRDLVKNEYVLVGFYKQERRIEDNKIFCERGQNIVHVNDRCEPKPYLENDPGNLFQVPDEHMEDRYEKPQGESEYLLNKINNRQKNKRFIQRGAGDEEEQNINGKRYEKGNALGHDDVKRQRRQ